MKFIECVTRLIKYWLCTVTGQPISIPQFFIIYISYFHHSFPLQESHPFLLSPAIGK